MWNIKHLVHTSATDRATKESQWLTLRVFRIQSQKLVTVVVTVVGTASKARETQRASRRPHAKIRTSVGETYIRLLLAVVESGSGLLWYDRMYLSEQ